MQDQVRTRHRHSRAQRDRAAKTETSVSRAHDIEVPVDAFERWLALTYYQPTDDYELLVTPDKATDRSDAPLEQIRRYFESAHADARRYYHEICNIDLHPVAGAKTHVAQYPNSLPDKARKGMFGEALCGMIVQTYLLLKDERDFDVPVFLFRHHSGIEEALTLLKRGVSIQDVPGRHGDDFLGVEVDEDGWITGFVVGEAKFRTLITASVYDGLMNDHTVPPGKTRGKRKKTTRGILHKMAREPDLPVSMNALKRILQDIDEERFEKLILSIEELDNGVRDADRVDLVVLICANTAKKEKPPYSPTRAHPADHHPARPLVIVELVIPEGEQLVSSLYDSLYQPSRSLDG